MSLGSTPSENGRGHAACTPSSPSSVASEADFSASLQRRLGPQSRRGEAPQDQLSVLDGHPHARACFDAFYRNEEEFCAEWAVFYHSYSFSALLYELQAAVAATLFGYASHEAPLPRLLLRDFKVTPDTATLTKAFDARFVSDRKDHHPEYRAVAISAMCSLVALGPEVSTPLGFLAGFSQEDVSFTGILEKTLADCYIPRKKIKAVAAGVLALCERYGLDCSRYGGQAYNGGKAGHLLQIFIKRRLVNNLVYAAHPYGEVDNARQPISSWLGSDSSTNFGQARVVVHPMQFLSKDYVRVFVASMDQSFHESRAKFQEELVAIVSDAYGGSREAEQWKSALEGLSAGISPKWAAELEERGQGYQLLGKRKRLSSCSIQ